MQKNSSKSNQNGFTLVEALIGTAIFAIVVIAVYALFLAGYRSIGISKARVEATALANEKMETIRNMPYSDIGTTDGWPLGAIPSNETVTGQGVVHNVHTRVSYVDDPFDGTAVLNTDDYPWDYKKVEIEIYWDRFPTSKPVILTSTVSPSGLETQEELGSLWIHVFNAEADPVTDATVTVTNNTLVPAINITQFSDVDGDIMIYGLPEATESYHIVVTKDGYTSAQTYSSITDPEDPNYNPYPDPADVSVAIGDITEISLAIDLVSTITVDAVSQDYASNWQINTDEGEEAQQFSTVGLDANKNAYFTWRDYRGNKWNVYSQKYNTSHEKQWDEDVQIVTAANQDKPDNYVNNNGDMYVVWNDDRNGNQDSYLEKYDTNGNDAWGGSKKIPTLAESADQLFPTVTSDEGSYAYIAWQDNRDGHNDIYARKSDNLGNFLWPQEIKINSDVTNTEQTLPDAAYSSDEAIYIGWEDERNGNKDIYVRKIDSDGNKLWDEDLRIGSETGSANQVDPQLVAESGGTFYIIWQDDRNVNQDIYAQKYNPDGEKQWENDLKVNNDTGSADQTVPEIDIDDANNIYIVWQDERAGNSDIYSQKYDFDGNKQWTIDQKINTNGTTTNQEAPDIAVSGDGLYIVYTWHDEQSGNQDIYAAEFGGPGETVFLPFVPLHVYGTNKIIGRDFDSTPILKYDTEHTTDANGNLLLENIEWDSYNIVPQDGSGYTLNLSDPGQPIPVEPNTTVNVMLNLTAP